VDVIFVTGLPGCGKSTVGRLLARCLEYEFIDLDAEVERSAGKSISQIFDEDGEPAFRGMEARLLKSIASMHDTVVALGAGALEDDASFEFALSHGKLIYLNVPLEIVAARIHATSGRPLMKQAVTFEDSQQVLAELLQRRRARYESAQINFVADGDMPVAEVAEELAKVLVNRERA